MIQGSEKEMQSGLLSTSLGLRLCASQTTRTAGTLSGEYR
jgi:hypothetical protein